MPLSKASFKFDTFEKGMMNQGDNAWNDSVLPDGLSYDIQDMNILPNGDLRTRAGMQKYNATNTALNDTNRQVGEFQISGTYYQYIVTDDGAIFTSAGTTTFTQPTDSGAALVTINSSNTTPDYLAHIVVFENVAYFVALVGNGYTFNGTTWTKVTDRTLDGSATEIPNTQSLLVAHERMWAAGTASNQNALRFSELLDADTWPTNNFIEVSPDDGQFIRKIILLNEQIIIFKDKSIYALAGSDPDSFTLYPVSNRIGCGKPTSSGKYAMNSIIEHQGLLYWIDPRFGIFSYDGASVVEISQNIDVSVSSATHSVAAVALDENRLCFSVADEQSWVYFIKEKAWVKYSYGFKDAFVSIDGNVYACDAYPQAGAGGAGIGGVYRLEYNDFDLDVSTPIPWSVTSGKVYDIEAAKILPTQFDFNFSRVAGISSAGTDVVAKLFSVHDTGTRTMFESTYGSSDMDDVPAEVMRKFFVKNKGRTIATNGASHWADGLHWTISGSFWGTLSHVNVAYLKRQHSVNRSTGS